MRKIFRSYLCGYDLLLYFIGYSKAKERGR